MASIWNDNVAGFDDFPTVSWDKVPDTLPVKVWTTESTHRDGLQGGLVLDENKCVEVYRLMCAFTAGSGAIRQAEFYIQTHTEREVFCVIADIYANDKIISPIPWISSRRHSVESLMALSRMTTIDEAGLFFPVSDLFIIHRFGNCGWDKARQHYIRTVSQLLDLGIKPNVHLADATRANMNHVVALIEDVRNMAQSFPDKQRPRFRICDTLGLGLPFINVKTPRSIPGIIRTLRDMGLEPDEIEFHPHNEMHLSVANCLSAIVEGCGIISGSLFGLGERTGNAPLEAIIIHLAGMGYFPDKRPHFGMLNKLLKYYEDAGYGIDDKLPFYGRRSRIVDRDKIKATIDDNPSSDTASIWKLFEAFDHNILLK